MCEKHTWEYRCNRRKATDTALGYKVCKNMLEDTEETHNPGSSLHECYKVELRKTLGMDYIPYCSGKELVWTDTEQVIARLTFNAPWCKTCQDEDLNPENKTPKQVQLDNDAKQQVEGQARMTARLARDRAAWGELRSPSEIGSSSGEE